MGWLILYFTAQNTRDFHTAWVFLIWLGAYIQNCVQTVQLMKTMTSNYTLQLRHWCMIWGMVRFLTQWKKY
ncbi:UNVERIFIED_CONTAM: hypothetical protein GTU68_056854 [Idotea baltica]|nr:hypothetical protein [Idotea baltica]